MGTKVLKKKLKVYETTVTEMKKEKSAIQMDIISLKAIVRQYYNKSKNVCAIAMTGIACEDRNLEHENSKLENGDLVDDIKSDYENKYHHNKVSYSYIDNEIFNNEM